MGRLLKYLWLALLAAGVTVQATKIIVYTPFYPKQVLSSSKATYTNSVRLLVSNVLMENRKAVDFLQLLHRYDPDIILINEPNAWWERQLQPLDRLYPYHLKQAQDNTYGMIFYSRLPLKEKEINFLIDKQVPSVYARVALPSGDTFDFYGLHPRPPKPGTDSYERDAEILVVGKRVYERGGPAIVAGDMNDVAWSHTSELFQRYSGLLDPRQGRAMFNTYNAKIPLLRYPLDHIFISDDFGLVDINKLDNTGSDHFPMLITLSFEPGKDTAQDKPEREAEDLKEANRKIKKGRR